ncbi:zinc ribbon domain-containing protein [Candidatus Methylacidiphilum fumarolicum]|uniref:zinc ribbon domain-containing protein n=1 Tax=Candidatus Methylacidiphilum fumarolicum TaxID=591154 RepID=UPI0036F1F458
MALWLCPKCGYVHPKNRKGDRFVCRHCGHISDTDKVGAYNLKKRIGDPEIGLWMPRERLHAILVERLSRRSGKPSNWNPEEGNRPGADNSRQWRTAADGLEAGAIAIVTCRRASESSTAGSLTPRRFPRRTKRSWQYRGDSGQNQGEKNELRSGLSRSRVCF